MFCPHIDEEEEVKVSHYKKKEEVKVSITLSLYSEEFKFLNME